MYGGSRETSVTKVIGNTFLIVALFTVTFSHLHYNII